MASEEAQVIAQSEHTLFRRVGIAVLALVSVVLVSALAWQGITASGKPNRRVDGLARRPPSWIPGCSSSAKA